MWNYEKRLEYPIKIKQTNPTLAAMIISQYGGPYFNKVYNNKIMHRQGISQLFHLNR